MTTISNLKRLGDLLARYQDLMGTTNPDDGTLTESAQMEAEIRTILIDLGQMTDADQFDIVCSDTELACYIQFRDGTATGVDYAYNPVFGERS